MKEYLIYVRPSAFLAGRQGEIKGKPEAHQPPSGLPVN